MELGERTEFPAKFNNRKLGALKSLAKSPPPLPFTPFVFLLIKTMPYNHPRNNLSAIPEVMWDSGLKEMNETWKGVIACFGVVVFLLMTIGIIYWQVVDQPNTNWILRSSTSGLIWDRKDHSLILQTLKEERTLLKIHMGSFPDVEIPFIKNICWQNRSEFCFTWEAIVELKVFLDSNSSPNSECYNINWTPLHCQVKVKVTNYSFSLFPSIVFSK